MTPAGDRLRVLTVGNMYPPHHLGGYELTWASSVSQLRAAGHTVRVLTTDYRRPDATGDDDPDVHRELRWYWQAHEFPTLSLHQTIALERHNARTFDHHAADLDADVVAWWAMGGMSLGLIGLARRHGLPAVGVVGDDWMEYGPKVDRATRLARGRGIPRRLGRAGTWLFNSVRTRDHAVGLGLPSEATDIANPGIDTELMRPEPEREWRWRLACVGRIDPRKGIAAAIDALVLEPAAKLRIAGAGDDRHEAELRERARSQGLDDRVQFGEAARTEVPEVFAAADAVLFPVLWEEPWGLIPLEAMACGRPVVASGRGGSREYLRDGQNCLIAEPEPGAIMHALRRLAGDADLRTRIRAEGLRTAARYDEEAYNRRIEAALLQAVR